MYKLYFVIGASGVGKTTTVKLLENKRKDIKFIYPDREMVIPTQEEMIKLFGSVDNWQKDQTVKRIIRVRDEFLRDQPVMIDTQSRFEFIYNACKENNVDDFKVILLDCEDSIRNERLNKRGQPHLINQDMDNWAKFLREDCKKNHCNIIDTTNITPEEALLILDKIII